MAEEPAGQWTAQTEEFNFVPFAADAAYRGVNRDLIARALAQLPAHFYHVDVASGTGLVPQEVCALCEQEGKTATVVGIDPDAYALESARRHTHPGPNCSVEFVQGVAQEMSRLLRGKVPEEGVDYASIHDAIHEINGEEDKRGVLAAMAAILRPGGLFTYNSAFTTAAMEESPMDWGRLKAKGFSILGGKRNRQAQGFRVHTPEEYRQMIVDAGLRVVYEATRVVRMSQAAMEAIGRYPAFIEGAFCDMIGTEQVSMEEKSRAIVEAVRALGLDGTPRVWHEIMAQKPA
jgi:ubiquinone/menaquinone biosynthesis C-methylase UbiE